MSLDAANQSESHCSLKAVMAALKTQTFIFSNSPTELLNPHYPFLVQNIILPSDHLHVHQTVISLMIMWLLPRIHSKKHLGVIRCKALPRTKMPYMEWCSSDFSALHMVARTCYPCQWEGTTCFSRVNLPPVTPYALIFPSSVYSLWNIRGEGGEWLRQRQREKSKRIKENGL